MFHITVIDDSSVSRMLATGLLRTNPNYEVNSFESARAALQHFTENPPDLVVSDLLMPQMDGFELVQEMKMLYPRIPVIVMTAYGNESIAVKALEGGAASYVPKASQSVCLPETVERVLARTEADRHPDLMSEYLTTLHCEFSLDRNPSLVRPFIDHLQHRVAAICVGDPLERVRAMLALEEALLTAFSAEHADSRSVDLANMTPDVRAECLDSLTQDWRRSPGLFGNRVHVVARISEEGAWFRVRCDAGNIKPLAQDATHKSECFESGFGRASMLAQTLMDEVVYNGAGGEVILVKRTKWNGLS